MQGFTGVDRILIAFTHAPNVGHGEGVVIIPIMQSWKLILRKMMLSFPQGEMAFEWWDSGQNSGFLISRSNAISAMICFSRNKNFPINYDSKMVLVVFFGEGVVCFWQEKWSVHALSVHYLGHVAWHTHTPLIVFYWGDTMPWVKCTRKNNEIAQVLKEWWRFPLKKKSSHFRGQKELEDECIADTRFLSLRPFSLLALLASQPLLRIHVLRVLSKTQ